MKSPDRRLYIAYVLLVLADIFFLNQHPDLRYLSKPFLMPVLLLAYRAEVEVQDSFSHRIMLALFLSWLGDVALMFKGSGMFIAGLSAFLSAHIVYISYFRSNRSQKTSFLKRRPVMLLAVVVFVHRLCAAGAGRHLFPEPTPGPALSVQAIPDAGSPPRLS